MLSNTNPSFLHPYLGRPVNEFQVKIDFAETHGILSGKLVSGNKLSCFLGLSPSTSFPNYRRLRVILQWLAPRTSEIVVLEGSFFNRWNMIAFDGIGKEEAHRRVLHNANRFERRLRRLTNELGIERKVHSLSAQEIFTKVQITNIQNALRLFSATNTDFAMDTEAMLDEYLARTRPLQTHHLLPSDRMTLKNYVFEELSVFIYLYQKGYKLEIYPGADLEIMRRISLNYYPGFPFSCPDRSHISIRLDNTI